MIQQALGVSGSAARARGHRAPPSAACAAPGHHGKLSPCTVSLGYGKRTRDTDTTDTYIQTDANSVSMRAEPSTQPHTVTLT